MGLGKVITKVALNVICRTGALLEQAMHISYLRDSLDSRQGALKPGSVGAFLPGNLLSHRNFEVKLGNNARNFLSPPSVVSFLLSF